MSKLEVLLKKHCPNGVPVHTLGEIGTTVSGLRGKSKNDFSDGNAPYVSYVDIFNNPEIDFIPERLVKVDSTENQSPLQLGDVLVTGSSETRNECGMTAVVTREPTIPIYINSFCFIWRPNIGVDLDPQFAKHLFRGRAFRDRVIETANGVTRQNISKPKFLAIEIPLPPIEVQREVSSILNKFTDLEEELEAELEARNELHAHYRDTILFREFIDSQCPEGVPSFPLGDLLESNRGGGTPSTSKPEYWDGEIPWTSIGDMNTPGMYLRTTRRTISEAGLKNSSTNLINSGDVLVAVKISPGVMKIASRDIAINQDIRGLTLSPALNPAFLVYYFRTFSIVGDGTIVKSITNATLEKVQILLPPIDVQNRIVGALDKLVQLEVEIEGELEARKTQYEYYRDKLLTFDELNIA
jgi:type I restriction enzyme S subunit